MTAGVSLAATLNHLCAPCLNSSPAEWKTERRPNKAPLFSTTWPTVGVWPPLGHARGVKVVNGTILTYFEPLCLGRRGLLLDCSAIPSLRRPNIIKIACLLWSLAVNHPLRKEEKKLHQCEKESIDALWPLIPLFLSATLISSMSGTFFYHLGLRRVESLDSKDVFLLLRQPPLRWQRMDV